MRSHKPLINRYDRLTPEERFRLLLLAEARGDTTEADYLEAAANNRRWIAGEHVPWRRAFDEMVVFTFIDLIESAHQWHGSWQDWSDICNDSEVPDLVDKTLEDRFYQAYLARGYLFQARVEAWKLFCNRLGTDPFECWRPFPGYDHLMQDINLATPSDPDSRITFTFDEFVDHLNTIGDKPVDRSAVVSPDSLARELDKAFRELVKGWGG